MHIRIRKIRFMRRANRKAFLARFKRNERGIALAELAIVIPVFVLLFTATAEFGRYFYTYTTLAKAERVAARYLATAKVSAFEDTKAKNLVVYGNTAGTGSPLLPGLTADNVIITKRNGAGAVQTTGVPQTVTVEITGFAHQPLFDLGALLNSTEYSMSVGVKPSVTMRYLLTTPVV